MSTIQTTRRVYAVEELHRLRNAFSLPRLKEAIEEREGDDAEVVKEHVLRPSKSFAARSFRSRPSARSLRIPSIVSNDENIPLSSHPAPKYSSLEDLNPIGPVLGEVAANGQNLRPHFHKLGPSPTPSIKKQKAEAIVKAHGSPTHIRVTAGGRIVPREQSPLCHPRYGYSAVKVNGGLIKFAPNHHAGKAQWTRATENGFVAQDIHGNLCQIVNGTILPLNQVDGALRLYIPAPNLRVTQRCSSQGLSIVQPDTSNGHQSDSSQMQATGLPEPSLSSQISALELEYAKLEHDLKDVDKTEVIHGRTMGKVAKEALIARRRELVTSMDKVRRALKAVKSQPPPNAPTSPRALTSYRGTSPSLVQLPTYMSRGDINDNLVLAQNQHNFLPFVTGSLPSHFNPSFDFQSLSGPDELYNAPPWSFAPSGAFLPSPYDGSLAAPPLFQERSHTVPAFQRLSTQGVENLGSGAAQREGSEFDVDTGARALIPSHAVSVKPAERPNTGLKSALNPMSPIYKPVLDAKQPSSRSSTGRSIKSTIDGVPYSPSPAPQSQRPSQIKSHNPVSTFTSPAEKGTHLHSSSISSFETADFFPRNTHHYSTRSRPRSSHRASISQDERAQRGSAAKISEIPDTHWRIPASDHACREQDPLPDEPQAPAPPPGTPVNTTDTGVESAGPMRVENADWSFESKTIDISALPNRDSHNVSPKTRRGLLLADENIALPLALQPQGGSQGEKTSHENVKSSAKMIDFTQKPRDWIQGYQAGLQCRPVEDHRYGDFLDGYCEGLLKSKPIGASITPHAPSTGSPTQSVSRRPSPISHSRPSMRSSCDGQTSIHNDAAPAKDRLEGFNSLKKAVMTPRDENMIFSSTSKGHHVIDNTSHIERWNKNDISSSVDKRQVSSSRAFSDFKPPPAVVSSEDEHRIMSEHGFAYSGRNSIFPLVSQKPTGIRASQLRAMQPSVNETRSIASPASPTFSNSTIQSTNTSEPIGTRISSMTSLDSTFYRPWQGHRIVSPRLDIKSASSISHAAGLATGFFAHAQFDGAPTGIHRSSSAGTAVALTAQEGRFKERALDEVDSPPSAIPHLESPQKTPVRDSPRKKSGAKSKSPSPAKVKFEHIAEKVGIKVSANSKTNANHNGNAGVETTSPPGKRRWRDVWLGGTRKDDTH